MIGGEGGGGQRSLWSYARGMHTTSTLGVKTDAVQVQGRFHVLCFSVLGTNKRKTGKIARQFDVVPMSPTSETAAVPSREMVFSKRT